MLRPIRWAISNRLICFALGLVVGLGLFALISELANPGWFEAVGTWVGGLGTVVAVSVAAYQLKSDREQRTLDHERKSLEDIQAQEERDGLLLEQARRISVVATVTNGFPEGGTRVLQFRCEVMNQGDYNADAVYIRRGDVGFNEWKLLAALAPPNYPTNPQEVFDVPNSMLIIGEDESTFPIDYRFRMQNRWFGSDAGETVNVKTDPTVL